MSRATQVSHIRAGVALRAVRCSPPRCSCEDSFHRDKATHCRAFAGLLPLRPDVYHHPPIPTCLPLSRYTEFPCPFGTRSKAAVVAFLLSWQCFYPGVLDLEQHTKAVRVDGRDGRDDHQCGLKWKAGQGFFKEAVLKTLFALKK